MYVCARLQLNSGQRIDALLLLEMSIDDDIHLPPSGLLVCGFYAVKENSIEQIFLRKGERKMRRDLSPLVTATNCVFSVVWVSEENKALGYLESLMLVF